MNFSIQQQIGLGGSSLLVQSTTPLLPASCADLSYYQTLFSYAGDGRCYSVILHSFIMRVIYDHGIIGFAFLIFCLFIYLDKYSIKEK